MFICPNALRGPYEKRPICEGCGHRRFPERCNWCEFYRDVGPTRAREGVQNCQTPRNKF